MISRRPYQVVAVGSSLFRWLVSWSEIELMILKTRQDGHQFSNDNFKYFFLDEAMLISIQMSLNFITQGPINYV